MEGTVRLALSRSNTDPPALLAVEVPVVFFAVAVEAETETETEVDLVETEVDLAGAAGTLGFLATETGTTF